MSCRQSFHQSHDFDVTTSLFLFHIFVLFSSALLLRSLPALNNSSTAQRTINITDKYFFLAFYEKFPYALLIMLITRF